VYPSLHNLALSSADRFDILPLLCDGRRNSNPDKATCETAVALLNTFPLFAVMLRIKEPSRIPGGIRFVLKHIGGPERCVLQLESQPISFAQIFARFGEAWRSLSQTYAPGRIFLGIIGGNL